MPNLSVATAENAALQASARLRSVLDAGHSFQFEAGPGAGKTSSLIDALQHLGSHHELWRKHPGQLIACLTYTKVARDEIIKRIGGETMVQVDTIHAFAWAAISRFTRAMRIVLPSVKGWKRRLEERPALPEVPIEYNLGYPRASDDRIELGHDDVLEIFAKFLGNPKFRLALKARFPILLIDEYQDTSKIVMRALLDQMGQDQSFPIVGLFGDYWQKIYPEGCGKVDQPSLAVIKKEANFRSAAPIVALLSRMRPNLPQAPRDPTSHGLAVALHCNDWAGERRTGAHWKGDLPIEEGDRRVRELMTDLETKGWTFGDGRSKVLMLTHARLGSVQGYPSLPDVFKKSESFARKDDPHIRYFIDVIEPAMRAFKSGRYGEMTDTVSTRSAPIRRHADKVDWFAHLRDLDDLRSSGTVAEVLAFIAASDRLLLPGRVISAERRLREAKDSEQELEGRLQELDKLHAVPYKEIINLATFLEEETPYATKHGVKGAEFDNVLVVVSRGWNHYDFDAMLQAAEQGNLEYASDAVVRARNLFYVACSRARQSLVVLFTAELSEHGLAALERWFLPENVIEWSSDPFSSVPG